MFGNAKQNQSTKFMTKLIILLAISTVLINCNNTTMNEQKNDNMKVVSADVKAPKVIGIGGVFFFSEDPQKTKDWYSVNLGFEMNDWGSVSFESLDINRPQIINSIQWTPFKRGDEYFAPSKKEYMINYRVQNIEGLVSKLEKNGVTIVDTISTYSYGKFVHIMDAEGTKIELWEPVQ
jgi:predicted enzyme related to lactoylglutathione lyase